MNSLNRSINNNNDIYYDDYLKTFNAHCASDNTTHSAQHPAPILFNLEDLILSLNQNQMIESQLKFEWNWNSIFTTNETNEYGFLLRIRILHYLIIRQYSLDGIINHFFSIGMKLMKKAKIKKQIRNGIECARESWEMR